MTNQAAPQLTWGVANAPANGAYTICASCFRLRSAVVTPRVPLPDGVLPLRPLGVHLSKPTWKACRHFHREGSGNEANQHAVRHRMSGLHSFRTIACGEWLIRGSVTYELIFPTLVAPFSAGIGVVTPHTDVNTDTAWCAGTRGWIDSWGLCIEGLLDEEDDRHEIRAIPGDAWAESCAPGDVQDRDDVLVAKALGLQQGDRFHVTIDADKRSLTIKLVARRAGGSSAELPAPLTMPLNTHPSVMLPSQLGEYHSSPWPRDRPPLALAVALKFAGDTCVLARRVAGDAEGSVEVVDVT